MGAAPGSARENDCGDTQFPKSSRTYGVELIGKDGLEANRERSTLAERRMGRYHPACRCWESYKDHVMGRINDILVFEGARPRQSNTGVPKRKNTPKPPRFTALDYLSFWCFGVWRSWPDVLDKLESMKIIASSNQCEAVVDFGGAKFKLSPYTSGRQGTRTRQFQLHRDGIYFGVIRYVDDGRPQLKVDVKGEYLSSMDLATVLCFVRDSFECLGFRYSKSEVSRLDLRTDLNGVVPRQFVELARKGLEVSRAKKRRVETGASVTDIQTYYVGLKGSKILCRFYDKLLESRTSPEKFERLLADVCGGELFESLCRIEFEIGRDKLKAWGLSSIEDCFSSMPRIVDGCTREYLRFVARKPDRVNRHGRNEKNHPLWDRVVKAFLRYAGDFQEEEIEPYRAGEASPEQLLNTVLGYLARVYHLRGVSPREVSPMKFLAVETEGLWDHPYTVSKLEDKIRKLEEKAQRGKLDNVKRAA